MNNLDVKLNDIEDKIVSERLRKADLVDKVNEILSGSCKVKTEL